jgi:hypothetical protein
VDGSNPSEITFFFLIFWGQLSKLHGYGGYFSHPIDIKLPLEIKFIVNSAAIFLHRAHATTSAEFPKVRN